MTRFWEFVNQEPQIIKSSYTAQRDIYDLAIKAWNYFITPAYFSDFRPKSSACIIYKTQADIALKQAITSILTKEYPQAISNIRFATENLVISIFGYADPDKVMEIMKVRPSADRKMREKANKFLEQNLPERSERFKGLHKTCDDFGAHQSLGHTGRNYRFSEDGSSFELLIYGEDSIHLNVGLAGIIIGTILEFHFAISKLSKVEWLTVADQTDTNMTELLRSFEVMKAKYLYLWTSLNGA